jgi:hypothetical protein
LAGALFAAADNSVVGLKTGEAGLRGELVRQALGNRGRARNSSAVWNEATKNAPAFLRGLIVLELQFVNYIPG